MFNPLQSDTSILIFILLALWSLPWKGIALWKAAQLSHKWWFIIILIANTLALVEIYYIFFIARKYSVETEEIIDENKKEMS